MRAILALAMSALPAAAQEPAPALADWLRRFKLEDEQLQMVGDDDLRRIHGQIQERATGAGDMFMLASLFEQRLALPERDARTADPADVIAVIRTSESMHEDPARHRFRAYADLLEALELAAQDAGPAALRLLLETAAVDLRRRYSDAEWRRAMKFRPHLVRREARLAILRIPEVRATPALLGFVESARDAGAVAAPLRETAWSLLATLAGAGPGQPGQVRGRLLQSAFVEVRHGADEATRAAAATAIEELLATHPELDVSPARVEALLEVALADGPGSVRLAVLRALGCLVDERVIAGLATALAERSCPSARIRDAMQDALERLSPVLLDGASQPRVWLEWYERERHEPRFKEWLARRRARPAGEPPTAAKRYAESPSFYGVPVIGRRVVFVIDVSGSMQDPISFGGRVSKQQMARAELVATLRALPETAVLNVIKFNDVARAWSDELERATLSAKEQAGRFIHDAEAAGGTNLFGGIERALRVTGIGAPRPTGASVPDQVILLSDGRPTAGRIVNGSDIVEEVCRLNADRAIRFDTVAFGLDADRGFLSALAERNGGTMVVKE